MHSDGNEATAEQRDCSVIEGELISKESRQSELLEPYLPEDVGMGRAYINPAKYRR